MLRSQNKLAINRYISKNSRDSWKNSITYQLYDYLGNLYCNCIVYWSPLLLFTLLKPRCLPSYCNNTQVYSRNFFCRNFISFGKHYKLLCALPRATANAAGYPLSNVYSTFQNSSNARCLWTLPSLHWFLSSGIMLLLARRLLFLRILPNFSIWSPVFCRSFWFDSERRCPSALSAFAAPNKSLFIFLI